MAKDFKHPKVVENYDTHIQQLIPGYALVHLQIQSILKTNVKEHAQILIAGCGTGYELNYLLSLFPQAKFVAFDPSMEMLNKAKANIVCESDLQRIDFLCGDSRVLNIYPNTFDVSLAILVSHFLSEIEKNQFFTDIYSSLNRHGFCLSYDLMQFSDLKQKQALKYLVQAQGLSQQQSQTMLDRLDDDFNLIDIQEMHLLLQQCGFQQVENFTQIGHFFGIKSIKNI